MRLFEGIQSNVCASGFHRIHVLAWRAHHPPPPPPTPLLPPISLVQGHPLSTFQVEGAPEHVHTVVKVRFDSGRVNKAGIPEHPRLDILLVSERRECAAKLPLVALRRC